MRDDKFTFKSLLLVVFILLLLKFGVGGLTRYWAEQQVPRSTWSSGGSTPANSGSPNFERVDLDRYIQR